MVTVAEKITVLKKQVSLQKPGVSLDCWGRGEGRSRSSAFASHGLKGEGVPAFSFQNLFLAFAHRLRPKCRLLKW